MVALLVLSVMVLGSAVQPHSPATGMVRDLAAIHASLACDTTGVSEFVDGLRPTMEDLDRALAQPQIGDSLDVDVVLLQSEDTSDLVDLDAFSEIDSVNILISRRSYTTALTTSFLIKFIHAPWTTFYDTDLDRLNSAIQELGLGCVSFKGSGRLLHLVRRARTAKTVVLLEELYFQHHHGPILFAVDATKFPDLGTVLESRGHVVHYYRFLP